MDGLVLKLRGMIYFFKTMSFQIGRVKVKEKKK